MKRFGIGCCLIFSLMRGASAADQTNTFAVLVTQRGTFTNASIRGVSDGYAIVIYEGGGQRIPLSELPAPIQKRYATNGSQPAVAANSPGTMSPAEYVQWQKDHAPELMLRQVNAQISVTRMQIAALQQRASELQSIGGSAQMPTQQSTITPITAEMFLSHGGAPHPGRSILDAYNDKLSELLKLKEQCEQAVLARQRAQFGHSN